MIDESILLIDDDPTQIAILSAYLANLKLDKILTASDAHEALQHLENDGAESVGMVFTDLKMPNMDGFEFLRHLSNAGFRGDVIIISGHEHKLLESAASLGIMYGLSIKGQIRKPLTKLALDRLFREIKIPNQIDGGTKSNTISQEELSEAFTKKEFVPYYQPKIDLVSGKVVGAEALARWIRNGEIYQSPGAFIPLVEKMGRATELGDIILDAAITDYRANTEFWADKKISINFPPEVVYDVKFPEKLEQKLSRNGIPNSAICIEITESGVIDFDTISVEVLSRLRIKGFDLSIDDFGTGAANISNLKTFPYSELKIDQTFINNVLTDAFSAETVRTSISLARQLGLRIVAEGIENEEILQFVKAKGIDQAQGYLFSKPVPVTAINELFESPMSWLKNRSENAA